ncbi:hypothetical protein BDZ97DRAFT_1769045 [Flammula alnicola]|nr:hypothetical protein BDZ97DRAFT_1769045 [Flammula alnicola]
MTKTTINNEVKNTSEAASRCRRSRGRPGRNGRMATNLRSDQGREGSGYTRWEGIRRVIENRHRSVPVGKVCNQICNAVAIDRKAHRQQKIPSNRTGPCPIQSKNGVAMTNIVVNDEVENTSETTGRHGDALTEPVEWQPGTGGVIKAAKGADIREGKA